jgi:hypothetical protein
VKRVVGKLGVALLVGAIAVSAMGGTSSASSVTSQGAADQALKLWGSFPINAHPRPVIDLGGEVSYPRDPLPFAAGRYTLSARLRSGPSSNGGYLLESARRAYRTLRRAAKPEPEFHQRTVIIRVALGSAVFVTDRGAQHLPAWLFYARGHLDPAAVLAARPYPEPKPIRPHLASVLVDTAEEYATSNADKTHLTIWFIGGHAGHGPCDVNYTVQTFPGQRALAYIIHEHDAGPPNQICADVGYSRSVTAILSHPLGPRVLIDGGDGLPVPIYRHPPRAEVNAN